MVDLDEQTHALAQRVEQLEQGPSTLSDWMGVEATLGAAMLAGQHVLTTLQRTMVSEVRTSRAYSWARAHSSVGGLARRLDHLRLLRLRVQSRIYEHQVTAQQSPYMQFS